MSRLARFAAIPVLALLASCGDGREEKAVREETVSVTAGGATLRGFLYAEAAATGKRPGVVVFPEWWGVNDYAKRRARMLADLGYVALAADLYGDGKTAADPDGAGKLAGSFWQDKAAARDRVSASLDLLRGRADVDPARVAAIGYCFGGSVVLQAARWGLPVAAVVSFHGNLAPKADAAAGEIRAKVLVCHGGGDGFISPEEVAAFKVEMAGAKADLRFVEYPGAKHSFTNPDADRVATKFGLPIAYDPAADAKSWADMKGFLAEVLK